MEELNRLLAQKLFELRKAHNVKQEEIARALNMSQQQYSLLERGQRNFSLKFIQKVCDFYKIPVSHFFASHNPVHIHNSPLSNIQNTHNSFNNDHLVIQNLIQTKDEIIQMQKQLLEMKDKKIKELNEQIKSHSNKTKG